jgi:Domain of unknown function (DUF1735)
MKLKLITLLTGTTLFLSSCLKDKGYQDLQDDNGAIPVVEIKEATETDAVFLSLNVNPPQEDVALFEIRMSSRGASNAAHTIKLALDPAAVTAYDPDLVTPTSTQVQLPSLDVTIPAGSLTAKVLVKVNKANLDLSNTYGLGFKIVDGGGAVISENSKSIVIAIGVKNKYDGVYSLRIKSTGWTAYSICDGVTGDYPGDYFLITSGAGSVAGSRGGDNLLPVFSGTANVPGTIGGPTAFGATTPVFNFDVTTDKLIDVVNSTPDDGRNRKLRLNPAITTSRYDPATKKIYAAFIMSQNGRPDQFFYDTLTYVKIR